MIQKKKICWLALVLCVCMAGSGQARAGAIQDKIDSTGEKINELENALDKADEEISAYQRQQQALEQDISQGQEKISSLSAQLDDTKAGMDKTQEEIEQTQEALEASREDSRQQYEQMKQRIRFMYENSMGNMLEFVLDSKSLSEALRRVNYFQAVADYDRLKLEEYKETTRRIKKEEAQLVQEKEELESLEQEQSQQLAQIDAAVQDLKYRLGSKIAQIQSSEAARQQYAQELEQQKQYEAQLERQKAEEDRKREEEIQRQREEMERRRQEQERQRLLQEQEQQRREEERQAQEESRQSGSSGGGDVWYDSSSSTGASSDLDLLAAIIYCEAGNQSYEGKLAVGSVIMNRVASGSFPSSISGVIYQSGQFSPVSSGRFAQALASGLGSSCRSVAQDVLGGKRNVTCLYFRVNTGTIDGLIIGDHVFY